MSLLFQILDEHKELLETKGYTEKSLNSPDKEGWFTKQLQLKLSKSIRDAHNFNETTDFHLKTTGFFKDDVDIVLFKLHYEYDPNKLQLYLKGLDADLDGRKLNLRFNNNQDLPVASEVHRCLAESEKLKKANEIANHGINQSQIRKNKRI